MEEARHHAFLNAEVGKALDVLMEHFDSFQCIGTYVDDDGMTHLLTQGRGNWYARVAASRDFIDRDQAKTTAEAIGEVMMLDEEDDGD